MKKVRGRENLDRNFWNKKNLKFSDVMRLAVLDINDNVIGISIFIIEDFLFRALEGGCQKRIRYVMYVGWNFGFSIFSFIHQ
jgi:hypothetical protein